MVMSHDQLGVNKNVSAKYQRCNGTVDELNGAVFGEERCHEAEDDQDPQGPKQIRHPVCEVVFGLACENGKSHEDGAGNDQSLEYNLGLIE